MKKTAEEILEANMEDLRWYSSEIEDRKSIIVECMQEYASQSHPDPTEAEINEAAERALLNEMWDVNRPFDSGFKLAVQWLQNYQTNKVVEDNTNTQKTQVGDDQTQGREKRVNFSPVDVNTYLPKQDGYVLAYCDTAGLWEKVWFDDALPNAFKHRYTHWLPWPDSPRNWQASQPNPAIDPTK